jgi:hypothetical protein
MRGYYVALALLLLGAAGRADSAHADNSSPCSVVGSEMAAPYIRHLMMSTDAAAYVVRHVRNACSFITEATRQGAPLEQISPSLAPILADMNARILAPIFRLHPELLAEPQKQQSPKKVYRATRKDISRLTATWLMHNLLKSQQAMGKVSSDFIAQRADQKSVFETYGAVLNATAELSAAEKVISDTYPRVWQQQLIAERPLQPRTTESDANFHNSVAARGSVKLTAPALAKIRSFLRQARIAEPNEDWIASLGWVIDQRSKGPEDRSWTSIGAGLVLGVFSRSLVPPDVIDKVDGIEVIFHADNPDRLTGKTIDFQKGNFVIRTDD